MRRGWQVTVVAVAGAALVAAAVAAGSSPSAAPEEADAATSTTTAPTATLPVLIRECYVPSDAGNVSLHAEEAMDLTALAAATPNRQRDVDRMRGTVERTLEDATPGQVTSVTRSLLGLRPVRLTCSHARLGIEPEKAGPNGLTPRAQRLRKGWTDDFGPLVAGGFARGGVSSGHVDSSSHYDGRAIDVFFRPLGDDEQRRRGRVFAQWLVAHAQEYNVLSIIYADHIWTSWAASLGWRDYVHPSGSRTNAVLRHLDHVHVAVESGEPFRG
ncbi:MAG TPA: hypothetical protein VF423_14850 [Actinomycetes bacterium]